MCNYDLDTPDLFSDRYVIAKKTHRCDMCFRNIEQGEKYWYVFAVCGGEATTIKSCAHCDVGHDWLRELCNQTVLSGLWDELYEHAQEYPECRDAITFITDGMTAKWRTSDDKLMAIPPTPPRIDAAVT